MSKEPTFGYIRQKQATDYAVLTPLLTSMYNEFQELSKKKPQEVLSLGKVKVVNRVLSPILELLDGEPTRAFLDMLDDDELPQNSDVVLMLGQVQAAMTSFRGRYYDSRTGWHVQEG
jgi:hypothetical protein